MLPLIQGQVRSIVESKLAGNVKEEALLYGISVERKIFAVEYFFNSVISIFPDFIARATESYSQALSPASPEMIDIKSHIDKISAYTDAFFMSGKSTLDSFAHEIRSIYGCGGVRGDLYFNNIIDQLRIYHNDTELHGYISSLDILNSPWYSKLQIYRRASAHESIIPLRPTIEFDYQSSRWADPIYKLPIDPKSIPLQYDGINFKDIGNDILSGLKTFLSSSYGKILLDIANAKTVITP